MQVSVKRGVKFCQATNERNSYLNSRILFLSPSSTCTLLMAAHHSCLVGTHFVTLKDHLALPDDEAASMALLIIVRPPPLLLLLHRSLQVLALVPLVELLVDDLVEEAR